MFNMKWLLVLCVLFAATEFVCSRPNKDQGDVYDEGDFLNDEDDGVYNGDTDGDESDDNEEDDDEKDLSIMYPPVIKTQSLTIQASIGNSVDLPCITENADAFTVMWKKNGTMIYQDKIQVGQRNDRYIRYDNQTLHIENIDRIDDGEYECTVSTSPGYTGIKHRLIVLAPPTIVSATANNGVNEVRRGGILELDCVADGNPLPKVSWSKSGSRVATDSGKFNNSRVIIENVGKNDGGDYMCMADNNVGKPAYKAVHVVVTHPPDMKVEKVIVGETELHLICKVHAVPKAEIIWIKNHKTIKHSNENIKLEHKHNDNELIVKIMKLEEADFGNYSCRASNHLGNIEKHVSVSGSPVTPKHEKNAFVGEDHYLMTVWMVSSMTPLTGLQLQYKKKGMENTWMSENPEFETSSGYMHNIKHILKHLEAGVYEVRLRSQNKYGWSDFSRAISVEGKPIEEDPSPIIISEEELIIEATQEPESSTSFAPRTIISWTTLLLVIITNII